MKSTASAKALNGARKCVADVDWSRVSARLDDYGYAVIDSLLTRNQCETLAASYEDDTAFRSRVVMARHGFGRGEYKYYSYPLPSLIDNLRTLLYPPLAAIANRWNSAMGIGVQYPPTHKAFLTRCHVAGQDKPTPLLLRYDIGDFNALHQNVYGDHVLPLQVAFLLSKPTTDFTGGEFVLTEQRPRMQSRAEVVDLDQGQGVICPVRHRPITGVRGTYRVNMRHGVSRLRSGRRHTVGIIFHDSK
jgi:hypothetical protein